MHLAGQGREGRHWLSNRPGPAVSLALEENAEIAVARDAARNFLTSMQVEHGVPVSEQASGMVPLVVSELVTNAGKYAPGPCLVTFAASEGEVDVTVWDSNPTGITAQTADPQRIGRHGLEIVMAVSRSVEVHREPVGKRVTATVELTDGLDSAAANPA